MKSIREHSLKKLEDINFIFIKNTDNPDYFNHLGVVSGASGIAMFQFYYSRFLNTNKYADRGLEMLSRCVEDVNNGYDYPTYCSGIAGLGWAFDHLTKNNFININDELLTDLDDYLYQVMIFYMKESNYDFLHGGLGYGFYFFKRYQNTSCENLKSKYKNYLFEFIDLLKELSETTNNTVKWKSIIDIETKEKGYNLSLSHGISSIINFISRLYHYDDFRDKVQEILKGSVNYVLSFKNVDVTTMSLFPNYIKKNEEPVWNSRVAWCYGDLGMGLSLWHAANALSDLALKDTVIEILKHTALRITKASSIVMDAGLCHGSFGNAQIFHYMYRQTKMEDFKIATDFWINDGLEKAVHKDGYAGFKKRTLEGWENETSLLEGIAGIGLAIISYLSEEELNWDECLMIS